MERLARGFRLVGASWEVLKADRELMVLPVVSFGITLLVGLSFFGLFAGLEQVGGTGPLQYILMAAFYFFAYAVGIFFNAAIIGAATIRLDGGDPTVRDGIRLAQARLGKILGWAALAASVGLVLRILEERLGFIGRIVIGLVGVAWSAVTFLVVPVLLYEEVGVNDSVKRSGHLFKERWGEQFVGQGSIGLAMFVIGLPVALVVYLLVAIAPPLGILVAIVAFGLLAAAGSAMSGIFNAALYRFATTGHGAGPFSSDDLRGAFREKRRRGFLG